MTTGRKIRQARKNRGLTQAKLSEAVGIPCERTRQYETDLRTPKEGLLTTYAEALDFPLSHFTDHKIESMEDVLNILFELDDEWDFSIDRNRSGSYVMTSSSSAFQECLQQWYELKRSLGNDKISYTEYEYLRAHICDRFRK